MRQAFPGVSTSISFRVLTSAAVLALVAGCQAGPGAGGDATRAAPASSAVQLVERDVEAPEVFSAVDRALWDGRPSLGGIWVAAPDVNGPERVIIRNEANGKFVIGALFRRTREAPGPALQLSSDAAIALGVLAGSPTTLDVVALRREDSPAPAIVPDETTEAVAEATVEAETPAPDTAGTDVLSAATAALDAVESDGADDGDFLTPAPFVRGAAAAAAAVPTPAVDVIPTVDATALDDALTEAQSVSAGPEGDFLAAAPSPDAATKAPGFFGRLFGNTDEGPAIVSVETVDLPPASALIDPAPTAAAVPAIEATSLTPVAAPTVEPVAVAAAAAPSGDATFVQVGIFSVEQNAKDAAASLSAAGVLPTVLAENEGDSTFWRVVVGPALAASDRSAILRTAKDLGFRDAFAVRG